MGNNSFCVPQDEVNDRAPFQSKKLLPDFSSYTGPITDRTAAASLPALALEGPAADAPVTTVPQLFEKACSRKGDTVCLRTERPCPPLVDGKAGPAIPLDDWKAWTYKEYIAEVKATARAFLALGLGPKDAVAIYGFNSPEWFFSEMAAIFAGGIAAGIYPTDTPAQVFFKARHSSASMACVESIQKAKPFLDNADSLPRLKAVIIWDEEVKSPEQIAELQKHAVGNIRVLHWSELAQIAQSVSDTELAQVTNALKPTECCAYIYTSGTTGSPKAVMISHDNIVFESRSALQAMEVVGNSPEEDRVISYLPLSHVAGMMVDIVLPMVVAAEKEGWVCVHFARIYDLKVSSIVERFGVVRPTIFLGVPRVWEKIAAKMIAARQQAIDAGQMSPLAQSISEYGKSLGVDYAEHIQMGGSGQKPMLYGLVAERLVQAKVKKLLGLDQCKFAFTGAAPISVETLKYFASVGININEVYGMSECSGACTWSTDKAHVWGSVGWAIPGVEVKVFQVDDSGENKECPIADDLFNCGEAEQGELCYRGRNTMMGYLANPDLGPEHLAEVEKKTQETVDREGWLHSGDKGCVDGRGMFRVTGRYKELLIGAGGENIAPVPIEDNIRTLCSKFVSNVMMIGDKMPFNCAVLTLKAEGANGEMPGTNNLDADACAFAKSHNSNATTITEAMDASSPFVKAIQEAIEATNNNEVCCPMNASKIQKFTILARDFSVDTDELTPTFKLKRGTVHEKYSDVIAKIYEEKGVYYQGQGMP